MSKKWETIYLDWDGVIWDFKQAFCDWMALEVPDTDKWEFYEELSMTKTYFEEILAGLPQEFWQQDKYIMPHAQDLVAWARRNAEAVRVLTVAPEWTTAQGKQNLARKHFNLGVYTVACAKEKVEFAVNRCLLIDDKPSTVVSFSNANPLSGGLVWPANYNDGMDESWYFKKSWLHEHKAHWALTDSDRSDMLKDEIAAKVEEPLVRATRWTELHIAEKPKLDYEAMDEAKKRKMTPMYSGLLAYFPDALAQVAQNSMVGHYQHNDPNDPMYWDRSKSADDPDGMIRHLADHSKNPYDTDGRLHLGKVAWRALAMLQKFIEEEQQNDDN